MMTCAHEIEPVYYYIFFFVAVVVQVDGNPIRLELCDTAGEVSIEIGFGNLIHFFELGQNLSVYFYLS